MNQKLIEKNRYFEIVDSFQTIGIKYSKGLPESIISSLIKSGEVAIASGVNVLIIEIDEDLFRKQERHNCFKLIDKYPPEGFVLR